MIDPVERGFSASRSERSRGATPQIFCFPHAGGAASVYGAWRTRLEKHARVIAIEWPGRGRRINEPLLDSVEAISANCAAQVRGLADGAFILFGHSMGALVAYEVARILDRAGDDRPARLVVAGAAAPAGARRPEPIHHLPRGEFLSSVRRIGGTPPEVFEEPEIVDLFEPILRADFKAIETYTPPAVPQLDIPIVAIAGRDDPYATPADLERWAGATRGTSSTYVIGNGHFFLHEDPPAVWELLAAIADQVESR